MEVTVWRLFRYLSIKINIQVEIRHDNFPFLLHRTQTRHNLLVRSPQIINQPPLSTRAKISIPPLLIDTKHLSLQFILPYHPSMPSILSPSLAAFLSALLGSQHFLEDPSASSLPAAASAAAPAASARNLHVSPSPTQSTQSTSLALYSCSHDWFPNTSPNDHRFHHHHHILSQAGEQICPAAAAVTHQNIVQWKLRLTGIASEQRSQWARRRRRRRRQQPE